MMVPEIFRELMKEGVLAIFLALALIAIVKLYFKNQELWRCMLELQQERLSDTKSQAEYVNSFRKCMETVVRALQESREAGSESVSP